HSGATGSSRNGHGLRCCIDGLYQAASAPFLPVFPLLVLLLRNVSALNGNQHSGSQGGAIGVGRAASHYPISSRQIAQAEWAGAGQRLLPWLNAKQGGIVLNRNLHGRPGIVLYCDVVAAERLDSAKESGRFCRFLCRE